MYLIINKPPPVISDKWSPNFKDFMSKCLVKKPTDRWDAKQLLAHPFLSDSKEYADEFSDMIRQYRHIDEVGFMIKQFD